MRLNRVGNASLAVFGIGSVLSVMVILSSRYFSSKADQLVREVNEREGLHSSELGALNARANEREGGLTPLEIQSASQWGLNRYRSGSLKTKKEGSDYCGVTDGTSSVRSTVCLRDLANQPSGPGAIDCSLQSGTNRVNFETYSDGQVPQEGDVIGDQFLPSNGISFCIWGMDNSADGNFGLRANRCAIDREGNILKPNIVQVGPPKAAFTGYNGADDMPTPGMHVGNYFLSAKAGDIVYPGILITYDEPVAEASGVVLNLETNPGSVSYNITAVGPSGIINNSTSPSNWSHQVSDDFGGSIVTYAGPRPRREGVLASRGSVVKWGFKHSRPDIKYVLVRAIGGEMVAAIDNLSGSKCVSTELESQ